MADHPVDRGRADGVAVSAGPSVPADDPGTRLISDELSGLALSRSAVDRAAVHRNDADWLQAAWADPGTRVLVVQDGQALVRSGPDGAELVFVSPAQAPDGVRFLLGVGPDEVVYFGVAGPIPAGQAGAEPSSLRVAGPLLSDRDAGLITHAVALANWHAVFAHCPRCGHATEPISSGHARRCVFDGSDHFPRLDPAVIMLVTDPDDRCLLARNAQWPQRRVSILAGFVEPGESAEQAVAREVLEEVAISVGDIRYVGSQPWPMPHSLMLGFRARAVGGEQIRVDADEIAEAHWFSRDELQASISSGEILLPPPVSIAHRIIVSWYGTELTGAW
jgi:NAD+ diphosphatase